MQDAVLHELPDPVPEIYFGGSSPAGISVAAKHADVSLTWGEPPDAGSKKLDRVRKAAVDGGRDQRYGIRLHTIARDTAEAAWAEADRMLAGISEEEIARVQAGLKRSGGEGQRRMLDLNGGTKDGLEVYPTLWAGVGLVRGGAGTALVGSFTEISDPIEPYADIGITEFVPPQPPARQFRQHALAEPARLLQKGISRGLADHDGEECRRLAGNVDQRFDDLTVSASQDGAVTLDEGLARFDCTIFQEIDAGDHLIVLLQLHAVEQADEVTLLRPLVFHRSGFGSLTAPA